MVHIGGNKLIFIKNIIGIFSAEQDNGEVLLDSEYVSEPPYKAYVVAFENESKTCKAYFTSLSARTLFCRLKKRSVKL